MRQSKNGMRTSEVARRLMVRNQSADVLLGKLERRSLLCRIDDGLWVANDADNRPDVAPGRHGHVVRYVTPTGEVRQSASMRRAAADAHAVGLLRDKFAIEAQVVKAL